MVQCARCATVFRKNWTAGDRRYHNVTNMQRTWNFRYCRTELSNTKRFAICRTPRDLRHAHPVHRQPPSPGQLSGHWTCPCGLARRQTYGTCVWPDTVGRKVIVSPVWKELNLSMLISGAGMCAFLTHDDTIQCNAPVGWNTRLISARCMMVRQEHTYTDT